MATKLTLRLDESLIEGAKGYAKQRGRSVSQLVADYFAQLSAPSAVAGSTSAAPLTASLRGALRGVQVDEQDYRTHLESKYR